MAGGRDKSALFAALPVRAIYDDRLTLQHLRILTYIAVHDQRSLEKGAGQGCWVGQQKMAQDLGINYSRLSTRLSELLVVQPDDHHQDEPPKRLGYLERQPHQINGRRGKNWAYRVLYGTFEESLKCLRECKHFPLVNSLHGRKELDGNVCAGENYSPGNVCTDFQKSARDQSDTSDKEITQSVGRYRKAEKDSSEAGRDIPLSGASLRDARAADDGDDAKLVDELTKLERTLKHQPEQVDAAAVYRQMFDLLETDLPPARSAQVERIAFAACDLIMKQPGQSLRASQHETACTAYPSNIDAEPSRDALLNQAAESWTRLDFMQQPQVAKRLGMSQREIGEVLAGRAHISDLKLTALRSAVVAEARCAVPQELVERPRRKAIR